MMIPLHHSYVMKDKDAESVQDSADFLQEYIPWEGMGSGGLLYKTLSKVT